ncbi:MAG TPA: FG-GAP-like repeat-containing protein [Candidatus Polarisedimenticolia bacterium]|nr:FG-GAP-like repeat-containing protein [Candidatus Polarisedimenticolia bacterium]
MEFSFRPGMRAFAPPRARLALAVALVSLGAAAGDADRRSGAEIPFVRPASRAASRADVATSDFVLRRRAVDLDLAALRAGSRRPGSRIRFDLFQDVALRGFVDRVERRGTRGLTVTGRIAGEGTFVLVVERAQVSGSIRLPGRQFTIGADAGGRAIVEEVDLERTSECTGAVVPPAAAQAPSVQEGKSPGGEAAPTPAAPDAGDLIDVLVAWTGRAETAAGGPAAARALAQRAVDEANVAYGNSGIDTRLRLVWRGRTEYDESLDGHLAHLQRLVGTGDGFMDEIHALRDATGADVVSLFVDDSEAAGLSYLMQSESTTFAGLAFSVVWFFAASNNLTLPHEIGHNQGCEHDRDHATSMPVFHDAYGMRFVGNDGRPYRTVMGYPPGQRLPNFSNPAVFYQGRPTGRANKEDNAGAINATADTVANFRLARRHPGSLSDFDGNGADDLATFDALQGTLWIGLARPPVFDTMTWGAIPSSGAWQAHLRGDFDGDGWEDLASFDASIGAWWVNRSRGDRFESLVWLQGAPGGTWLRHLTGDFDGNGRDDVASLDAAGILRVALSSGSGFTPAAWGTLADPSAWAATIAGDYDGDGRDDLAHYDGTDGAWWVSLSTGTGFATSLWDRHDAAAGWGDAVAGDFNGDGREDLAHLRSADGALWVEASTGAGFVPAAWAAFPPGGSWGALFAGDFDGDGLDDVAAFDAAEGGWWVGASNGGAFAVSPWSALQPATGWTRHEIGDFDGDGRMDVADYLAARGEWWVGLSTGASFETSLWESFVLPRDDTDTDGDGLSDAADCDPTASDVWARPDGTDGLMLDQVGGPGSAARLQWQAPASIGGLLVHYDVLRSDSPWYFGWGSVACLETNDAGDRQAVDPAPPAPIWYYLVRAGNACGEGSLGADSAGAPRQGVSCP